MQFNIPIVVVKKKNHKNSPRQEEKENPTIKNPGTRPHHGVGSAKNYSRQRG
jgi:hypothetical protein